MAGTVSTVKTIGVLDRMYRNVYKIVLDIIGDVSDGTVPDTDIVGISGYIERVEYVVGSTAPTTGFDLTIENDSGFDILGGAGADIVSASNAAFIPIQDGSTLGPVPFVGTLTVKIANTSVNSSDFQLNLYVS